MVAKIYYREFWGINKLEELSKSVDTAFDAQNCKLISPHPIIGSPFVVTENSKRYFEWPDLREIFLQDFSGIQTKRDSFLINMDEHELTQQVEAFFDAEISDEDLEKSYPGSMKNLNNKSASKARRSFLDRGLLTSNFFEYNYKPFDKRFLYWEGEYGYLGTPSHKFVHTFQNIPNNYYLEFRKKENTPNFSRFFISRILADNMGNGFSNYLPMKYVDEYGQTQFNLRKNIFTHADEIDEELLFYYVVAVLHSSKYREQNKSILTKSTPRIPNDLNCETMIELAKFGKDICSYYCSDLGHSHVKSLMATIAIPETSGRADLSIDAEWGRPDPRGAVFPGVGLPLTNIGSERITHPRTGSIIDITNCALSLNKNLRLISVPRDVLDFEISGYKVIKKWLSYRSEKVIHRSLKSHELEDLKQIIIRVFLIKLTSEDIDSVLPL